MNKKPEKTAVATVAGFVTMYSCVAASSVCIDPATVVLNHGQAVSIATAHMAGSFVTAELESENGTALWEVLVLTTAGERMEVAVDANSGEIVKTELDDQDDQESQ